MSNPRREITRSEFQLLLLFLFFLFPSNASSLPCDDKRCKTDSCDDTGACICSLPDPSTIFDGERPFLGGKFCDEEQIMCDGTNSFWCEHGSRCNEIVHGENYTCNCLPGYTGEHCQYIGAPCGKIFCFHQAECLVEGDVCECPPDWKGSVDCSLPTRADTTTTNSTSGGLPQVETRKNNQWLVVFFAISCSLGAGVGAIFLVKKYYKQTEPTVPKFQQLSEMQMHRCLDDDEDDLLVPETIQIDNSHL
ncbi:uncharacterized protein LOC131250137 [Magnolia sinica]|uniref:uncharacterized protein LOC131250137 n=1 Tax=Magnolia sinica TaxID=86752 RepID=UPI0026581B47|nr:uncharacterized protein LOC131250137 [Magnolia sinica]